MANKYSMIRQHQPLRTPAGWSGQEKAFIVQLEEIFDDIYRKFGRLGMNDMDKKFRVTIEGKYDIVSGIEINENGIEVSGSKYVNIISGGKLYVSATNFVIDSENKYMRAGDWVFHEKGEHWGSRFFLGSYELTDFPASGNCAYWDVSEYNTLTLKYYINRSKKAQIDFGISWDPERDVYGSYIDVDDLEAARSIYIGTGGNRKAVKTEQTAKSSPSASGTDLSFIDTVSQDTQGVISATKKTVKDYQGATSSANGVHGLVPAASSSNRGKYLRGDGAWETPTDTNTWRGFQVKTWDTTYTVNANTFHDITANDFGATAPAGYSAVAVSLFNPGNDKCWVSAINVHATGTTPMMTVHNPTGNNLTNHAYISILYLQN